MRFRIAVVTLSALLLMGQAEPNFNPNNPSSTTAKTSDFRPAAVPPFDLIEFADKLEDELRNRCAGYQFVVSFNDKVKAKRAGGSARKSPDLNPRAMSTGDRYNVASVSKTITAAAALKLLRDKNVSVDARMAKYLPKSFTLGDNIDTITFRELLTHRSGIHCGGSSTSELQECVAAGIQLADKGKYEYANSNIALFRFLIPELEDFSRMQSTAPQMVKNYPARYIAYVQKAVFDPAGLPEMHCKPPRANPPLCYQFPCPEGPGDHFGDATETCGAKGWNLSSEQLATFISALLYTEKILPRDVREQMKNDQLGIFKDDVEGSVVSFSHGGFFPGKHQDGTNHNGGELNSLVYGLSNGVSVALIVNSQYGTNRSIAGPVKNMAKEMIE